MTERLLKTKYYLYSLSREKKRGVGGIFEVIKVGKKEQEHYITDIPRSVLTCDLLSEVRFHQVILALVLTLAGDNCAT